MRSVHCGGIIVAILCFAACEGCHRTRETGAAKEAVNNGQTEGETLDASKLTTLYSQGADLGVGYNMRAGELLTAANCLEHFEVEENGLNITEKNVMVLESKKQLDAILGIEGTGSFLIGPVSVTISAGFEGAMDERTTSVFVLVLIEKKIAEYRIKTPTLRGLGQSTDDFGLAAMFQDNPQEFEGKCGDHFVQSIITGGRYIGLIEIEAGNQANKMDIKASLAGHFIPLGVGFEGHFRLYLKELASRYRVRIRAASLGIKSPSIFSVNTDDLSEVGEGDIDAESQTIGDLIEKDLESFFADIDSFYVEMEKASTAQDYRQNAFMTTFDGYERAMRKGMTADKSALLMRERLADMLVIYDDYLQRIAEMVRFPEYFESAAENGEATAIDKDALEDTQAEARYAMRVINDLLVQCSSAGGQSCIQEADLETLPIVSTEWLAASLPRTAVVTPSSCDDLKCRLGYREDDLYRVFLNGDAKNPFEVYCGHMGEDADQDDEDASSPLAGCAKPSAYLPVAPNSDEQRMWDESAAFNFSTYSAKRPRSVDDMDGLDAGMNDVDAGTGAFMDAVTKYDLVPIHINNGDIIARPRDPGEIETGQRYGAAETALDHVIYLDTRTENRYPKKMANIDLSATPFKIGDDVKWTVHRQPVELVFDTRVDYETAVQGTRCRGGVLATVMTPEDVEMMAHELEYAGIDEAWVGLRCKADDDRFRWDSGKSYDYTPYLEPTDTEDTDMDTEDAGLGDTDPGDTGIDTDTGTENASPPDICVVVTVDGILEQRLCDEKYAYFVEYAKYSAHADVSPKRNSADLYVSSHGNSSVLFEPENDLVLEYRDPEVSP